MAVEDRQLTLTLDVTIRPAQRDDLDQLEWFGHQRSLRPHIEQILDRREHDEAELLVAVIHGFSVGRIGVDFTRRPEAALLWSFAVIPNLQGLGIGTALIRAGEAAARSRGYRTVEIDVEKNNPRAQALYERLGYAVVGERQDEWTYVDEAGATVVVRDDEWVLRKALS